MAKMIKRRMAVPRFNAFTLHEHGTLDMITIMSHLFSILRVLEPAERLLSQGHQLFRAGDAVRLIVLVVAGEAALQRVSGSGTLIGVVLTEARVAFAPIAAVRRAVEADTAACAVLARHLARETQMARMRAELLALRRLTDRVDGWLTLYDAILPPRGRWATLASDLSVTPEALYRALARRRSSSAKH